MNKAILSGRICNDIELKTTSNDISVCNFTIAVNRRFKNAEGNYETDFINIVAWRGTAEFISRCFPKGKPIEIVGSIQTRSYDREDGQKGYVTEVVADEAYFVLSDKTVASNDAPATTAPATSETDGFVPMPDSEDLPF